jgi:hypothetical protein
MLETLMIPSSIVPDGTRRRHSIEVKATAVPDARPAECPGSRRIVGLVRHNMPGKRCRIRCGR